MSGSTAYRIARMTEIRNCIIHHVPLPIRPLNEKQIRAKFNQFLLFCVSYSKANNDLTF